MWIKIEAKVFINKFTKALHIFLGLVRWIQLQFPLLFIEAPFLSFIAHVLPSGIRIKGNENKIQQERRRRYENKKGIKEGEKEKKTLRK